MNTFRIIARLDIKAPHLVKGVRMEGLRVVGDPVERAILYAEQGADELHIQDIMASVYHRPISADIIKRICERVHIPVTVGGGIRTVDDGKAVMDLGCEKVHLNTAAIKRPELITELAQRFGIQAVSVGVEDFNGDALCEQGREGTGWTTSKWITEARARGAGEIALTNVDFEGTKWGFARHADHLPADTNAPPTVFHGGFGDPEDGIKAWSMGAAGIQVASALHHKRVTIQQIKQALTTAGANVRPEEIKA